MDILLHPVDPEAEADTMVHTLVEQEHLDKVMTAELDQQVQLTGAVGVAQVA